MSRYIDICNEKKVDLFTPMSELGGMDSYEARPYIDELISFLEENLIYTQFTFQNFLFSAVCKPYYGNCGTDYNKLSLIGWSAFESIAWTDNSSIYEMKSKFRNQHLVTVDRVHRRFPNLEQLIYEIGFPSVNKGSMIFFRAVQEGEHVDYEEQRRAVAAVMRGLYDYIKNGNDFLKGIFWCNWVIYSEANNAYWLRNNFQLFRKPAIEEIYTFFSSKPEELFDLPLYFAYADWFNAFVDFRQEVAVTHVSHPLIVQDFERIGGYGDPTLFLAHYGIVHTKALVDLNLLTSRRVAYNGNQSLEILYDNFTGRGGEAVIIPKLELDTWQDVDTISLSIKREDPNIGLALILFDTANPQRTYTQRLPLHKVGEWEQIGVYIDNFDRVVGSGDTTIRSIGREHLNPNYIGILLYSLDGSPVDSEVYIDDIGVTLKSQE